jgi:uncharacterized protein
LGARDFFSSPIQIELLNAAEAGDAAKIESLLAAGAKINETGKWGMSAALWAMGRSTGKAGLACLLQHGANPNLQLETDGKSVMEIAAMHDDIWYLDAALQHGGNPNLINHISSWTPIFNSIMSSSRDRRMTDHIMRLIDAGADLNFQDVKGKTPMMVAATANRYDLVYIFLKKGADPSLKNRWGKTLLDPMQHINIDTMSPMYQWKLKVVEVLKSKGIDVEHGK